MEIDTETMLGNCQLWIYGAHILLLYTVIELLIIVYFIFSVKNFKGSRAILVAVLAIIKLTFRVLGSIVVKLFMKDLSRPSCSCVVPPQPESQQQQHQPQLMTQQPLQQPQPGQPAVRHPSTQITVTLPQQNRWISAYIVNHIQQSTSMLISITFILISYDLILLDASFLCFTHLELMFHSTSSVTINTKPQLFIKYNKSCALTPSKPNMIIVWRTGSFLLIS